MWKKVSVSVRPVKRCDSRWVRKNKKFVALLAAGAVFMCAAQVSASLIPPDIVGNITATEITDGGVHDGWYFYEISVEWDLNGSGGGLSHFDIIFESVCSLPDIDFDSPAGYSTSASEPTNPNAMGWTGYFEPLGDPTVTDSPVIKFNSPHVPEGEAGAQGYGTFSFYADGAPVYGVYTDALVAKAGTLPLTYGDLTGYAPACITPEPTSMLLLGIGGFVALLRKLRA